MPLTASCFSKIQIGFTFLVSAHLGSPRKRAVKWVCVCVLFFIGITTWSDMISVNTVMQWREDQSSASVVNHTVVTDPTIRQPVFNLPCHTCSLMNCFQTGQGPCHADLHNWGLTQSLSCDRGQRQTMNHIVHTCPLTEFEGGLNLLHEVDDMQSTVTAALAQ